TPHGQAFASNRPVVMARKGMVSSGHPLASQAGITMLQRGGNAVDAALAVATAISVVEPLMSGIGGDGFIMVYTKADDKLQVVNATGAAPYAATLEKYQASGIPMKGILSVSVPSLLKGWTEVHARYGTLSLSEVMQPALDLAANGFPVSHLLAKNIASDPLICEFPTSAAVYARAGRPIRAGEILYQENLAKTYEKILRQGDGVFYEGEVGHAIVKFFEEQGGLLSMKDLADHHVRWQEPISTSYRGHRVYEAPPNSSGHVLLQALNLAEQFDLRSLGANSLEAIHMMVEAKRMAFADREAYMADPEWVEVPIPGLLSKEYAAERAKGIDVERAAAQVAAGDPWRYQDGAKPNGTARVSAAKEDTTCFAVVDQWGNAVSMLQSIQSAFGSSVIAGDTGVLLNNRMTYWHLDPNHIDVLEPGKRVRHTMNPVMAFREGADGKRELALVCGTPGADTQVQTNFQVVTHVLDFGMTVAEAVEAPRWRHVQDGTESTVPHAATDELRMEGRFPADVTDALKKRGHPVTLLQDWEAAGSEVMIQVDPDTGVLSGAADPRRDGYAIGW
ncbi:MAG: gamma-glutamyltransferase, partial [SAR202 cluster bacterium]|nr:gamma-glutamyltransferase [SAR202 cluster bacterium]